MTIAVITGGRDRTPTLFELEQLGEVIVRRGITVVRHGDCRGTDRSAGAWVKSRKLATVEPWPADWTRLRAAAGPIRNRAMLDGGTMSLLAADLLIHFRGGVGTADCTAAAIERGIPVEFIADADEPRPWNRHHGEAPGPSVYIGRRSPLGNPFPLELAEGETRATAAERILAQYRSWLWAKLRGDREVRAALEQLTPDHHLVCSCWPAHCHAEVVIRAWRWLQAQRVSATPRPSSALASPMTAPEPAIPSHR